MLSSARFGSPPRQAPPTHSSYGSSSEESFGHDHSLSRSESGTSRTHYEDFLHTPISKGPMNQFNARSSLDWDNAVPQSPDQAAPRRRATQGIQQDPMAMHLLLETAVSDSAAFDIMTLDELEEVKREEASISRRLPALRTDMQMESKLRDAAYSVNNAEYSASAQKCDDLNAEIYHLESRSRDLAERRLKHTAGVLQIDYEQRTNQADFQRANGGAAADDDDEDDWAAGFNLRALAPGGLADTPDGIMDIPLGGEPFSLDKFSERVQRLVDRAAELESRMQHDQQERASTAQLQAVHDQHQTTQKKLQDSQADLMDLRATLDQTKQELSFSKQQQQGDKDAMQAEVARLQTEVTIARAELDGAYGTRAERVADVTDNPEYKQLEARNVELDKELRELVLEHEALTRQGVDTERDRETLETTIDQLRDKVETLEIRISEDKLRYMGRAESDAASTPGSNAGTGADSRSVAVMRTEFKKMMRDARAEQFKVLRAEQDERRKLEQALRSLRKEQVATSPGLSPATLSPPPLGRSGLRQNMTAS